MSTNDMQNKIEFLELPVEILIKILSYFPKHELMMTMQFVCKKLEHLSHHPYLWKEQIIDINFIRNNPLYSENWYMVEILKIEDLKPDNSLLDKKVSFPSFPKVKHLQFNNSIIWENLFKSLTGSCPNVESLTFTNCVFITKELPEIFLQMAKFHQLKHFRLEDSKVTINQSHLEPIVTRCRQLECLDFRSIPIYIFSDTYLKCYADQLKDTLTAIYLYEPDLSDVGVSCLSICQNLREVELQFNSNMTNCVLDPLAALHLVKLTLLCVEGEPERLGSNDFERFFQMPSRRAVESLKFRHAHSVNDTVLQSIAERCVNLKELSISYNNSVTFIGLSSLADQSKPKRLGLYECSELSTDDYKKLSQIFYLECEGTA